MPINDFQLAAGHITSGTLTGSSTYTMTNFPLQSDQSRGRPWTPPSDRSTFPRPARIVRTADGSSKADGFLAWSEHYAFMTESQLAYLDTLLGWSDTVWSANVTVQRTKVSGTWVVIQAIAHRPDPYSLERSDHGYRNVIIEFTNGVAV